MDKDQLWYFKELRSNECYCGKSKEVGRSFCYTCFKKLPGHLQKPLYNKIGSGYEEAYEDAVNFLD